MVLCSGEKALGQNQPGDYGLICHSEAPSSLRLKPGSKSQFPIAQLCLLGAGQEVRSRTSPVSQYQPHGAGRSNG